ncbi:MAG: isocitrate lyase/PEP mutase family protein [candidate division NC10 bacterium]|nr:isocitrate lyase/PEP mutase family protein [candidate division NC10 bacterium]
MASKGKVLRALLQRPGLIVAPGVYDALSARICEMVGFEAVSHSGYGTAAVTLGRPDIGLLDMTEMVRQVGAVAGAVEIPVLGDADTGFGNAVNVHRTVQEYIRAGAAGLFIEDQLMPKRCGHMRGKQVISMPEMLGKLRAAMDARTEFDPDFVIMCRIDAIAVNGFEDALARAKAAVDLGVDMIFVEAPETREQMERVGREIKAPLMLNLIEGGKTPLTTYREAEEMGFKYVVPALTALFAAAKGMYDVMRRVREEGVSDKYLDRLFTFQEFAQVVHLDRFRQMEERYLPSEVLEERYRGEKRSIV